MEAVSKRLENEGDGACRQKTKIYQSEMVWTENHKSRPGKLEKTKMFF